MNGDLFELQPPAAPLPGDRVADALLAVLTPAQLARVSRPGLEVIRDRVDEALGDMRGQLTINSVITKLRNSTIPQSADEVAQILSPSQVETWRDCQARWYFKYVRQLEELSDGRRGLGRAVHKAFETYYKTYLAEHVRLDLGAINALARAALAEELKGPVVLTDGDNAATLEAQAVSYTALYLPLANTIEPAATELNVWGEIAGVSVRGRIDVIDSTGCIEDLKTASKKPSGVRHGYRVQLATYAMLWPACDGRSRVRTIVKTKTPAIYTTEVQVTPKDKAFVEHIYPLAQEGMRAGIYMPNRESFFCDRRSCSFWAACEKEFGGEVQP